jgi:hypothetical protein
MNLAQRDANPRNRTNDSRQPAYVVRAPDPINKGRWITLGAAWARKNGEDGFTVKLNSVPVGPWDGSLILLPPLGDADTDGQD